MATSTPSLDELRRRIDEIDDRLHELIMQRAALVEQVAGVKKRGRIPAIRPGREAKILRRLMARHRGGFPRPALLRIWRELVSGSTTMQGPFAVAVLARDKTPGYWDLARDHFGGHTPMSAYHSVGEVLRVLADGRAAVGVLPVPADGERDPWWPLLAVAGAAAPRIIARLPFVGRGNARGDAGLDALMIGHAEVDPTGADRSLIAVEIAGELSRARLIGALAGAGLEVTLCAGHDSGDGGLWSLVELDDWVTGEDPRLAAALAPLAERVARVVPLGFYAKPFTAAALAGPPQDTAP